MNRSVVLLTFCSTLVWAQPVADRVLKMRVTTFDGLPVSGATVQIVETGQRDVSGDDGSIHFVVPPRPTYRSGTTLEINVTYEGFVYKNGILKLPQNFSDVVKIRLVPKSNEVVVAGNTDEILRAILQDVKHLDQGVSLQAHVIHELIKEYFGEWVSSGHEFSVKRELDHVEQERPQGEASVRTQAMSVSLETLVDLFKEAAAGDLNSLEEVSKQVTRYENAATDKKALHSYLEDVIGRSESLRASSRYTDTRMVLEEAFLNVDKSLDRSSWVKMATLILNSEVREADLGGRSQKTPEQELGDATLLATAVRGYRKLLLEFVHPSKREEWTDMQAKLFEVSYALDNIDNIYMKDEQVNIVPQWDKEVRDDRKFLLEFIAPSDRDNWAIVENNFAATLNRQGARTNHYYDALELFAEAEEASREALQVFDETVSQWETVNMNFSFALLAEKNCEAQSRVNIWRDEGWHNSKAQARAKKEQAVPFFFSRPFDIEPITDTMLLNSLYYPLSSCVMGDGSSMPPPLPDEEKAKRRIPHI